MYDFIQELLFFDQNFSINKKIIYKSLQKLNKIYDIKLFNVNLR